VRNISAPAVEAGQFGRQDGVGVAVGVAYPERDEPGWVSASSNTTPMAIRPAMPIRILLRITAILPGKPHRHYAVHPGKIQGHVSRLNKLEKYHKY
jgi:hypothetical protein